ncbi:MAG: hypothetical protein K8T89_16415 [Planctomycetes bacterium]|nr:hypothetical protein [Planctomycetota bacterium]
MRLPHLATAALLTSVLMLSSAASAKGCCKMSITLDPLQLAIMSDAVVVGEVTALEPELVMIESYPGSGKVAHMVAVVRVDEGLLGSKGLTHLRVAFIPQQNQFGGDFGFQCEQNERSWRGPANLAQGQTGCFFLQKHAAPGLFVPVSMGYPISKSSFYYSKQISSVRNILRVVEKPVEALQVKESSDRQLAACALIMKYRNQRRFPGRVAPATEAVSAEESRLVLKALSEMTWGEHPFDNNGQLSVQNAFASLQLTEKDGWRQPQPKEGEDHNTTMNAAFAKWLKEKGSTYRIQKMVDFGGKVD